MQGGTSLFRSWARLRRDSQGVQHAWGHMVAWSMPRCTSLSGSCSEFCTDLFVSRFRRATR